MTRINPQTTVPAHDGDVIEWFQGYFDGIYAILHPFIKTSPQHRHLFEGISYSPQTREQLKAVASPVSWERVLELTGVPTIQRLNRLLSERIGAIQSEDHAECRALYQQLVLYDLVEPREGWFPELLLDQFLLSLTDWGYESVVIGSEWGEHSNQHQIRNLLSWEYPTVQDDRHFFRPTIYTEDFGFLYGVHWDSFYTFLCGPREIVSEIVLKYDFEGFFFEPGMRVYWMD
jgi:hypothetical protein